MCKELSGLGLTLIKYFLLPAWPSVYLRKLSDDEQPLRLRLLAGPSEKALSFVLKENDSGEVNVSTRPLLLLGCHWARLVGHSCSKVGRRNRAGEKALQSLLRSM